MKLLFSFIIVFILNFPSISFSQLSEIKPQGIIYANSPDRVPNKYIVIYKKQENSDLLKKQSNTIASALDITQSLASQSNSQIIHVYDKVLFGSALFNTDQASIENLFTNTNVKYIYADISGDATTSQHFPPSNLDRVDQLNLPLNQFYNYTSTGNGVNVYVVDSGVLASHPEFSGRVINTVDFTRDHGTSLENIDALGHGTGVAGVIGGLEYGVAKNVTIESLKVIIQDGTPGGDLSSADVISALDYIANNYNPSQPNIVNLSFKLNRTHNLVTQAISDLINRNIIVVAAAGNDADNACSFPSSITNVITIGAMNSINDERWIGSNYSTCVDIYAPGYSVESSAAQGGSLFYQGTSFASPHVVGAVALYLENNPGTNPVSMRSILKSTASRGKIKYPNSSNLIPSNENYLLNVTNLMPNSNNMNPDIYEQDDNDFSNNNIIGINNSFQNHNFEDDTVDWIALKSDTLGTELNSPDGQCNNLVCGLEFSNISQELLSGNSYLCFQYSGIDISGAPRNDFILCGISDGFYPRSNLIIPQTGLAPFQTACDADYQLAWNHVKIQTFPSSPDSNKFYDVRFRCDYTPTPPIPDTAPDIYENDDTNSMTSNQISINGVNQHHNFYDDSIDYFILPDINTVATNLGVTLNANCDNLSCSVNVSNNTESLCFSPYSLPYPTGPIPPCNLPQNNISPELISNCSMPNGIAIGTMSGFFGVNKGYDIKLSCTSN